MNTETITIRGRSFATEDRKFFTTNRSTYAAGRMWSTDGEVYALMSTSRSHKLVGFFAVENGEMIEWTPKAAS